MTKSVYDFVVPDNSWTYPVFQPFTVYLSEADKPIFTYIDRNNQVSRVIFEKVAPSDAMRTFLFAPANIDLPDEAVIWCRREEWEGAAIASYLIEITEVDPEFEWPESDTPGQIIIEQVEPVDEPTEEPV